MWRCAHFGQDWTVFSAMKLGAAKAHTTNAVSAIAVAFQREKYSMALTFLADHGNDQEDAPSSLTGSPLARTSASMERI